MVETYHEVLADADDHPRVVRLMGVQEVKVNTPRCDEHSPTWVVIDAASTSIRLSDNPQLHGSDHSLYPRSHIEL